MRKIKQFMFLSALCVAAAFTLTGCGNNTAGSTSGNNNTDKNDLSQDVSEAARDTADAAKDVAENIGDATDDLLGSGGFDNYNDAHDYFLETMGAYHSDAEFELRDEDRELNDYQEGSKGYHFYLYDTSKNSSGERFGEFFVDATSGKIYERGDDNVIVEYPTTSNSANARGNNGTNF